MEWTSITKTSEITDEHRANFLVLYSLQHMPKEKRKGMISKSEPLKKLWNSYQKFKEMN